MQTSESQGHDLPRVLADAVERRRPDIEERWIAKVREDTRAASVHMTELKDAIGEYIQRIAKALRDGEAKEHRGLDAWIDVASRHALTRIRIGFDVEQLVRELVILRGTVTEVLREEGVILGGEAVERITQILDDAIGASLRSYVQARDYQARRQQAEHLGFLAHQVRSPLSAAMLSFAQVRLRLATSDESTRALDRAERSLKRMQELIDEVLLVGQLEANTIEAKPVETTLGELLEDVLVSSREAAERKGLVLRAEYDPTTRVSTDPKLTISTLEHLLENAIKYTDEGVVSLQIQKRSGQLEFHVRDTCPGLSSEELAIVFEPFRRGRSDKGGSGLGLAIARRAASALGGEIHAESAQERGCHFWFVIPIVRH